MSCSRINDQERLKKSLDGTLASQHCGQPLRSNLDFNPSERPLVYSRKRKTTMVVENSNQTQPRVNNWSHLHNVFACVLFQVSKAYSMVSQVERKSSVNVNLNFLEPIGGNSAMFVKPYLNNSKASVDSKKFVNK
ncbi:hypothetical protein LIER_34115 [Lithospermum erythrorhizon]|uniref:Uncharacterized protein n=1 Tax=Lithospermum erythrorhizon TaxID=34254 RepID=A0AAV3S2A3_LITER